MNSRWDRDSRRRKLVNRIAIAAIIIAPVVLAGSLSAQGAAAGRTVREFTIINYQWGYSPPSIVVGEGDLVRLRLISSDITHGFAINEYGINIEVPPGKVVTVEFVATKPAYFYCSIFCGSGHFAMKGELIVSGKHAPRMALGTVWFGMMIIGLTASTFSAILGMAVVRRE